jgi:hypothetical protein
MAYYTIGSDGRFRKDNFSEAGEAMLDRNLGALGRSFWRRFRKFLMPPNPFSMFKHKGGGGGGGGGAAAPATTTDQTTTPELPAPTSAAPVTSAVPEEAPPPAYGGGGGGGYGPPPEEAAPEEAPPPEEVSPPSSTEDQALQAAMQEAYQNKYAPEEAAPEMTPEEAMPSAPPPGSVEEQAFGPQSQQMPGQPQEEQVYATPGTNIPPGMQTPTAPPGGGSSFEELTQGYGGSAMQAPSSEMMMAPSPGRQYESSVASPFGSYTVGGYITGEVAPTPPQISNPNPRTWVSDLRSSSKSQDPFGPHGTVFQRRRHRR